jgi:hypothetical protein
MNNLDQNKSCTCHEHIEYIYRSPQINKLISKVYPESLQDDLRQELALALLTIECDKIIQIYESNALLAYSLNIIKNMAFSNTSPFYKKFRKKDYEKALEYLNSQLKLPELNINFAQIANKRLTDKYLLDEMQAHEAILFNKYVEFRSCKKVADFYNIPEKHVKDIIRKTKLELKTLCLQSS